MKARVVGGVVAVGTRARFSPVQVEAPARNPEEVAVEGIAAGAMVALVDVEREDQTQ